MQLRKEITKIEDILHSVKSLTPVEEINSTDEKEVLVGCSYINASFNF